MPDLLLEVLSEEIPARMQEDGSGALKKQVLRRLEEARLQFDAEHVQSFATPRRLALLVRGLPAMQPDITVERKGPRVDAPEKAIDGFLKSTGLTLDDCEQRETPKGPVWFAVSQEKGRPTTANCSPTCCRRRWPRSPGPSPCAGMRAACAGCARSAPSSACWTMRRHALPLRRGRERAHHARPPLPLVRPAHGRRCR